MEGLESDQRVLLTKLAVNQEHLQKDFNRMAQTFEKNSETQVKQTADTHKILLKVSESIGQIERLRTDYIDLNARVVNAESFIAIQKPAIERKNKIVDGLTSKILWVIILGIAGLFYANPFK